MSLFVPFCRDFFEFLVLLCPFLSPFVLSLLGYFWLRGTKRDLRPPCKKYMKDLHIIFKEDMLKFICFNFKGPFCCGLWLKLITFLKVKGVTNLIMNVIKTSHHFINLEFDYIFKNYPRNVLEFKKL